MQLFARDAALVLACTNVRVSHLVFSLIIPRPEQCVGHVTEQGRIKVLRAQQQWLTSADADLVCNCAQRLS